MMKVITVAAIAGLALAVTVAPMPAQARDGDVAVGIIGGLAVGTIIGSQMNRDDDDYRYRRHNAYASDCRIERRDFEDRYGRLHVRRVRVCD